MPEAAMTAKASSSTTGKEDFFMKKTGIILIGPLLLILLSLTCEAQTAKAQQEPFPFMEQVQLLVAKDDWLVNICREYMDGEHRWKAIAVINRIERPNEKIAAGTKLYVPLAYLQGTPIEGKVTFVQGDARVQKDGRGDWTPLKLEDRVAPLSNLQTGRNSVLEITFEDGSSFLLRSHTLLGILTAQKKGPSHLLRDLFVGAGRVTTKVRGATGEAPRFNVRTPSAVASVRGTEFRIAVDETQKTFAEALERRIAVSAAGASVDVNEGEGTMVKKGEPPQPPRKLLPPPGPVDLKTIYNTDPVITFGNIKDAQAYRIATVADKEGKQALRENIIDPREVYKISGLADASYYLLTQSIDEIGLEGRTSEPFAFAIRVNPLPPILQSPRDGAEIKGKFAKFEWMSVRDAQKYSLQIAEDGAFHKMILDTADIATTNFKTRALEYKTYHFRLSSIAPDAYQGAWSDVLTFTLTPPTTPSLDQPDVSKDEISLRSKRLGDGFVYHFQIAKEEQFKDVLLDRKVEEPEITILKPQDAGTYYVRVAAIDRDGVVSDFSAPQSFEIKDRIPYEWLGGWLGALLLFFLLAP
jgi:hypothetical protein